jgi:hypothetical protein
MAEFLPNISATQSPDYAAAHAQEPLIEYDHAQLLPPAAQLLQPATLAALAEYSVLFKYPAVQLVPPPPVQVPLFALQFTPSALLVSQQQYFVVLYLHHAL